MTGSLPDPKQMTSGGSMKKEEDVHILRLSLDLPPNTSSRSIRNILIDAKLGFWCFQPGNQDTWNSGISLEEVNPDTFCLRRLIDGM